MVRPSASNLTGWQRRSVKAKASALLAALTQRLDGREWGRFFSFLRCKPRSPSPAPAAQNGDRIGATGEGQQQR
jgi:hypothetical protein